MSDCHMVLVLVIFPGAIIATLLAFVNFALLVMHIGAVIETEPLIVVTMLGLAVAWVVRKATVLAKNAPEQFKLAGRRERSSLSECCICNECWTDCILSCEHRFHETCIARWWSTGIHTCPMCRAAL